MKLLYDHQIFSSQVYGGISRYFFELISRFSVHQEIELGLYLGYFINQYGLDKYRDNCFSYFGKKHEPIPKTARIFSLINSVKLFSFGKKFNPDIYHRTYYGKHLNHINVNAQRVLTVYDMIHEKLPEYFSARDKTSYVKQNVIGTADGIIAISESTKRDLIEILNVPEEKIEVIYLANSLSKKRDNISTQIDFPFILYVGARNGYKNFKLLLETFSRSVNIKNNFKLLCFGGGPFSKEEVSLTRRFKLEDKVIQVSGNDDLLADLYMQAAVFVYPSLYEGFGIPPLEAMHYGCPVIASNNSSIPEVVGNAGLLFEPTSSDELLANLDKVLNDMKLKNTLVDLGYQRESEFSWDKCAQETFNFYKSLLAN